jgi:hypothetical protein
MLKPTGMLCPPWDNSTTAEVVDTDQQGPSESDEPTEEPKGKGKGKGNEPTEEPQGKGLDKDVERMVVEELTEWKLENLAARIAKLEATLATSAAMIASLEETVATLKRSMPMPLSTTATALATTALATTALPMPIPWPKNSFGKGNLGGNPWPLWTATPSYSSSATK